MRALRFLRDLVRAFVPNPDARALGLEILVVMAVSLALGMALYQRVPASPPWARAQALSERGDLAAAEEVYWAHLRKGRVTVPLLLDFLDNHAALGISRVLSDGAPPGILEAKVMARLVVPDERIDALLAGRRLSPRVALLGRYYWRSMRGEADDALVQEVTAAADASPPAAWANHVMALVALREDRTLEAASRFEREGLTFQARHEDLEQALRLWLAEENWEAVGQRLSDPRWSRDVDPFVRHQYALHVGAWKDAARWLLVDTLRPELAPLLLALVAALMWFLFVARLGKLRDRPLFRGGLYAAAFLLGVVSIAPTLLLITVEEHFLHLEESGDLVRDAIYFVFGVGLREELAKLLLFAPLLPILRRHGSRLDVLACGAMVGLGFAFEENLGYFAADLGTSAVGRFLTANFLHITMTALCADALDHFMRKPSERSLELSKTFLTVVAMHGAYDFFSANPAVGELSFLSVMVFILLTRQFLEAVKVARGRSEARDRFLRRLVQAIAVVAGASFVYACAEAGPAAAAAILAVGLLGDAIIIYVFVHETRNA